MSDKIENKEVTADEAEEKLLIAGETPAARFSRIASARLTKAIKAVSLLENCAGYGYEYTEEQVAKMMKHLNDAVSKVEKAYKKEEVSEKISL